MNRFLECFYEKIMSQQDTTEENVSDHRYHVLSVLWAPLRIICFTFTHFRISSKRSIHFIRTTTVLHSHSEVRGVYASILFLFFIYSVIWGQIIYHHSVHEFCLIFLFASYLLMSHRFVINHTVSLTLEKTDTNKCNTCLWSYSVTCTWTIFSSKRTIQIMKTRSMYERMKK